MSTTLSELRVKASYDGRQLKSGLAESKAEMQTAAREIAKAATDAEVAVKASASKMGDAYKALPQQARAAMDQAVRAHQDYEQKVTQSMQRVGVVMSAAITLPFAVAAREALQLAADFQQNFNVLQASIGGTDRQMKALADEAIKLGADMTLPATSAVDAAKAMTQLAKGGLDADNVLKAARGTMQLAAATGIQAADAATIQARALAAFSLSGDQATHVADLMAKATYSATGTIQDMGAALASSSAVMAKAGMSIDETVTAITELAKAGIVGSDAGTSLKQMFIRLEEGGSLRRVRDILHGLGIEVYDSTGRMKSMRDVIGQFGPAMEHLTQQQRNAALAIIFGSDALRASQIILGGGVQAYDQMSAKLEQEGAAAELAAARNKGLAGALDGLRSAWETTLQQSAEPVIRPLETLVRGFGDVIGAMGDMDPAARTVVIAFGAIAAATGPVLVGAAAVKSAMLTLGIIQAASVDAAAADAAAKATLAAANDTLAVSAEGASAADATLSSVFAAELAEIEALSAAKGQLAVSNVALASSGATVAATEGTAAISTGGLSAALAAEIPVVLAVVAVVAALVGGYIALDHWANKELDDATRRAKMFRDDYQGALDAAKAKVSQAKAVHGLLEEYLALQVPMARHAGDQQKEQDLANQISLLQPELVKAYTATGDAILDVAKAHEEAARQAQNQYDKEQQLAQQKMDLLDAGDVAQKIQDLRDQGAGQPSLASIHARLDPLVGKGDQWQQQFEKIFPAVANGNQNAMGQDLDNALSRAVAHVTLAERNQAQGHGNEDDLQAAKREELKAYQDLNKQLRDALAEQAKLQRDASDQARRAKLGPEGYAKYEAQQAKIREQADFKERAEKAKADAAYQADYQKYVKAHGYVSAEELAKAPKEHKDKTPELTVDILDGMAKHVKTPAGQASCAWFAESILKATGAVLSTKDFHGGANDLVARLKAAGAYNVAPDQAKAGDVVYYPKRAQPHVGIYTGDGMTVDSSGGKVRPEHPIYPGAEFLRPVRTGKYSNADDTMLEPFQKAYEAERKADQERQQRQKAQLKAQEEIEKSYKKVESATAAVTSADGKYADMLGIELAKYEQLNDAHKRRAEADFAAKSKALTDKELGTMQRGAAADAMADPTERAVAQYKNSLADSKQYTEADKARMVDERRKELVADRARELAKELTSLQSETKILEATNEQERIRLQLQMSRPDLKPDELAPLAKAEYDKFTAGNTKKATDEVRAKEQAAKASEAQAGHDKAIGAIQNNLKLTEAQRYKLIEDQNDALQLQLVIIEDMAKVSAGDLSAADAKRIEDATRLAIAKDRMARDEIEHTDQVAKAQQAAADKLAAKMDQQSAKAKELASQFADIIIGPLASGKGFKGIVDAWRQTVRQMAIDWAKQGLAKSLEPMFRGKDLRQYQSDQAAKAKQLADDQKAILGGKPMAASTMTVTAQVVNINGTGPGGKDPHAMDASDYKGAGGTGTGGSNMNWGGMLAGLSMAIEGGKHGGGGLVEQLLGLGMLLSASGAFGKGGWMHFAAGGQPPYGQPVVVGEFGPELWMPPQSGGRIHPSGSSSGGAGGGTSIYVTQNISTPDSSGFRRSSRQIASEMSEHLDRETRRNFPRKNV